MSEPQAAGRSLVLVCFDYVSCTGQDSTPWNCAGAYRCDQGQGQMIQIHRSYTLHGMRT
jgi:hypothetical protein